MTALPELSPFRAKVLSEWKRWQRRLIFNRPIKPRWIAYEIGAREDQVLNAMVWLELNGYMPEQEPQ